MEVVSVFQVLGGGPGNCCLGLNTTAVITTEARALFYFLSVASCSSSPSLSVVYCCKRIDAVIPGSDNHGAVLCVVGDLWDCGSDWNRHMRHALFTLDSIRPSRSESRLLIMNQFSKNWLLILEEVFRKKCISLADFNLKMTLRFIKIKIRCK